MASASTSSSTAARSRRARRRLAGCSTTSARPNLACAWQPPYWAPEEPDAEAAAVGLLGADLAHLHVYAWEPDGTRRPLHSEADRWRRRFAAAGDALAAPANSAAAAGTADAVHIDVARPHLALVEFVPGDDPACLADEVATLRAVLGG
ncbi:MAG: hypothetical protein R2690_15530 [Acidimicrobiales bacterium]